MIDRSTRLVGFDATPLAMRQRAGVGYYAANLLNALLARDDAYRFALLAHRPLNGQTPPGTLGQIGQRFGNKSVWLQWHLPRELAAFQPTVCHFTNTIAPLPALPCPFVVTIHDLSLLHHSHWHPLKSRLVVRPLIPLVAHRATAIITVSETSRREIIARLNLPPHKVHAIYAAAAPHFRVIRDAIELDRVRRRYHLPDKFVLYVGTIEPRKNLVRLVQAFARQRCSNQYLIIAGQLGWHYAELLKAIETLGIGDAVRLIGYVPDEDLPALYNLATIFAYPSIYEGFGLPVIEAMACHTPVLTSNRSSLKEIADGAALLLDPMNVEALTEGMAQLMTDAALRDTLRCAGQQRAAQFSWAKAASETTHVYDQCYTDRTASDISQPVTTAHT